MQTLHRRVLITHPEMGVYLGSCMGLGFWSKLDPVGQNEAVTFISREEAQSFVSSWDSQDIATSLHYLDVQILDSQYATIAECVVAGADAWSPDLAVERTEGPRQ